MVQSKIVVIEDLCETTEIENVHAVKEKAERLSLQLKLPLIRANSPATENYEIAIFVSAHGLALRMLGHNAPGSVTVDFDSPALNYRIKDAVRGQAIAKAVGFQPGINLTVVDATAGFGKDSFLLAYLGCKVTLVERNVIVHALLLDGIERASQSEDARIKKAVSQMDLIYNDFRNFADSAYGVDIVYLDPMFPKRRKSARVKKDMYLLQKLLSNELTVTDENSLLIPALALAGKRVVVKRPKHSLCLAGKSPTFELSGKSSRYDVYMTG